MRTVSYVDHTDGLVTRKKSTANKDRRSKEKRESDRDYVHTLHDNESMRELITRIVRVAQQGRKKPYDEWTMPSFEEWREIATKAVHQDSTIGARHRKSVGRIMALLTKNEREWQARQKKKRKP